jgi:hypothetical protein
LPNRPVRRSLTHPPCGEQVAIIRNGSIP